MNLFDVVNQHSTLRETGNTVVNMKNETEKVYELAVQFGVTFSATDPEFIEKRASARRELALLPYQECLDKACKLLLALDKAHLSQARALCAEIITGLGGHKPTLPAGN